MGGVKPLWVLVPALILAAEPAPVEVRARLPQGGRALIRLAFRKGLQVEAQPLPAAFLAGRTREAWVGYDGLSPQGRRWVLESLWPEDQWRKDEVIHQVRWPDLESVWLMAALWCGHGQNHDRLQEANPGAREQLRKGDLWRIPRPLLSVDFGGPVRGLLERHHPEDDLEDEARIAAYRALLTYQDGHAAYRLRKGETLYSSVVMRYTDRTDPREVTELAMELARAAGIPDVRAIPPGTVVKLPVRHLAAPFQPEGAQALREERAVREEVRRTVKLEAGPRLRGVNIVLDPGHGGIDVGAMANGAWESDFVYDIAMRVRELLKTGTEAEVFLTVKYPGVGFRVRDRIAAPTREALLLTAPPVAHDGEHPSATAVHLRWVLANDVAAAHQVKGDPRKTLFISLHADSLHPTVSGTMVYVPGAAHVPDRFSLGASRGAGVAELRRGGKVTFSARERLQAEARSRVLAELFAKVLKQHKLPVHANRPIRNVINRGGKSYVPAVIRYSTAATKILVEVANLQNEEDAERLKDAAFRQRYAEALVAAIRAHYGR